MLNTRSQFRVIGSSKSPRVIPGNPVQSRVMAAVAPRSAETASIVSPMMGGGVNNNLSINTLPAGSVLYDTMLSGLVGDNEKSNYRFYRDIYAYDTTAGSAVDLMATMPFSPFQLDGCTKPGRVAVYQAAIEALNFKTLLPEISVDRMVMGACTMTPIYRASEKRFVDMISWQAENVTVTPTPFLGIDPLITIRPDEVMRSFLTSESEYFQKLRNNMSQDILEALHSSAIELDPLSTIFLPRKSFTFNHLGTSYFRRILPLYLLEKALYRGTLIEAGRRQRAMLQIACLAGNSLISTEQGLVRIDSLFEHQPDGKPVSRTIDLNVRGYDGQLRKATNWHYRGNKKTVQVTTESGRVVTATADHKFLTLSNGVLRWQEAANLQGASVCVPVNHLDTGTDTLDLVAYEHSANYNHEKIQPPVEMTEDLAYVLGALTGDGSIRANTLAFRSKDSGCAKVFLKRFNKVFDKKATLGWDEANKLYVVVCNSVAVSYYLGQLGCYVMRDTKTKGEHSQTRNVPTSVLKSSTKMRLAYTAGFLDTDGTVSARGSLELRFFSASKSMLLTLQALLVDMGYLSGVKQDTCDNTWAVVPKYYLSISPGSAARLYNALRPYIADSRRKVKAYKDTEHGNFGVPTEPVIARLDERVTKMAPVGVRGVNSKSYLIDDSGCTVVPAYPYGTTTDKISRRNCLPYHDATGLLAALYELASCDSELRKSLDVIIAGRYKFETVVSVEKGQTQPVYDLTMAAGNKNAFVANGVVVHNCGDDLWEPTSEEIQAIVALFQQADFDPLGAIVGTRSAITTTELRCIAENAQIDVEGYGPTPISRLLPEGFIPSGTPTAFDTPGLRVRGVGNEYREVESLQYQGERQVALHRFSDDSYLASTDKHCVLMLRRGSAKCVLQTVGALRPADEVELIGVNGIKVDEGDSVVVAGDTISVSDLRNLVNCRVIGNTGGMLLLQGKDDRTFRADPAQQFVYRSLMETKKTHISIKALQDNSELPGVWELLTRLLANTGNSAMWVLSHGMTFAKYTGKVGNPWVCHTYDLTMKNSHEPFFMVDGSILTKNSGGDFWKYTDITDLTLPMKMRGLGISESFLSQEASFAAMDVSLSVFTENLRTYRTDIQQRIFYGKLFPLIAYMNDFFTKDMTKEQEKYYKETSALGEIKLKHKLNDATMLDMPVIHWEKALRPEVDQAHLDTLATLKQNNVPVGIATWAAAGGMSTDDLLKEVRANEDLKKKISEITGKPADEGSEEFARVRAVVQPGPRGLLSRGEFQHEYVTTSRTGKKKAVVNQKAARDQVYSQLEGLIKERAANPQHHYNMVKAVKARGGIPDIIGATSGPTL